jgi:hypothetical protein
VLDQHLHVRTVGEQRPGRPVQIALTVRRVLQELPNFDRYRPAGPMCEFASMTYARTGRSRPGTQRCVVARGRIT